MKETIKKSNVPGLTYIARQISNRRYLKIIHQPSGVQVFDSTYQLENINEAIKLADEILSKSDWTITDIQTIAKSQTHLDAHNKFRTSFEFIEGTNILKIKS